MLNIVFYIFALLTVISAFFVVLSGNLIMSVFCLILCFLNAAVLFIICGAEYIGMMLLIIYVGAVVIFLLFIVMTMHNHIQQRVLSLTSIPIITIFFIAIFTTVYNSSYVTLQSYHQSLEDIANMIYNNHFITLQIIGLILLTTLIGVVKLTDRKNNQSQKSLQMQRSIIMTTPKINKGVLY
jgi:NADH-quinone oxidoreductase subunit J